MKRLTLCALTGLLGLGIAAAAWGEALPWKGDDQKKSDAAAGVDLKSELSQTQYAKAITPIEGKLALAQKAMEPWEKEKEKPIEKQNPAVRTACKMRAASGYLAAAAAAKRALRLVSKDEHKAAIVEQYQKPNEQKAIDIYLELANEAHEAGKLAQAVALYRKVLSIDAENSAAKVALTRLAEEYKQAMKDRQDTRGKGGGDEQKRSWETDDWGQTGRVGGDWSKIGRPQW